MVPDFRRQPLPFRKGLFQLPQEAGVLNHERLFVLLLLFRANVAAGGEYETLLLDALDCLGFAEAGDVAVGPLTVLSLGPPRGRGLTTPLAEGVDDPADILNRGQDHLARRRVGFRHPRRR